MDKGAANVDTNEFLTGEILAHSPNFLHVEVRLANGEEIKAVISKSIVRQLGCIFGNMVGWKVRVVLARPPKMHRIIELQKPIT